MAPIAPFQKPSLPPKKKNKLRCSAEKNNYVAARIDWAMTSRLKITASPRKKGLNEGHPYSTGLQYHKLNRQMVPHKYGQESLGSLVRAKRYVK